MKNKLMAFAVALMVTLLPLVGCGGEETKIPEKKPEGPKYIFRLAETHPPDYPTTLGDKKFAELVYQYTNGRIKIEVFPSAQLGEEKPVIEQVQLGAIEFTRVSSAPLAEFNRQFGVYSLPYIFESDGHVWRFLDSDIGKAMLDNLEQSRMKGLAYYSSGSRNFYTQDPVTKVADLRGMKIRVQQNRVNIDLIKALGAAPTPLPYGEVLGALQDGMIDGAENNPPSYLTADHYQVARNYILDGHLRVPEVLLISKATWDRLPETDRSIIKQAALESVKFQRELWGKFESEAMERLRASGVKITQIQDVKPWQQAVQTVIEKYYPDYREELDAIEKTRRK
jgi:tripartite ATP-independent transporter DctP family solute receptor